MMLRKLSIILMIGLFAGMAFANTTYSRLLPENITASGPYGYYNLPPSATVDRSGLHGTNEEFHQNVDTNYTQGFPLMLMLYVNQERDNHPLLGVEPLIDVNDMPYVMYQFDQTYELGELMVWNYNHVDGGTFESETDRGYKEVLIHYLGAGGNPNDPNDWTLLASPREGSTWRFNEANGSNDYEANTFIPLVAGPGQPGLQADAIMLSCKENWGDPSWYGLSEVQFNYVHDCICYESASDLDGNCAVDVNELQLLAGEWLQDNTEYTEASSGLVPASMLTATGPSTALWGWDLGPERAIDRSGISVKEEIVDPEDPNNITYIYQHSAIDTSRMWMTSHTNPQVNSAFPHPFGDPNSMGWIRVDFVNAIDELVSVDVYEVKIWNFNGFQGAGSDFINRNIDQAVVQYYNDGNIEDPNNWTTLVGGAYDPNNIGIQNFELATGYPNYEANTILDFGEPGAGTAMKSLLITARSQYAYSEYLGLSEIEFHADIPALEGCVTPPVYDLDGNCMVNLVDMAMWAKGWMEAWLYDESCTEY